MTSKLHNNPYLFKQKMLRCRDSFWVDLFKPSKLHIFRKNYHYLVSEWYRHTIVTE